MKEDGYTGYIGIVTLMNTTEYTYFDKPVHDP